MNSDDGGQQSFSVSASVKRDSSICRTLLFLGPLLLLLTLRLARLGESSNWYDCDAFTVNVGLRLP